MGNSSCEQSEDKFRHGKKQTNSQLEWKEAKSKASEKTNPTDITFLSELASRAVRKYICLLSYLICDTLSYQPMKQLDNLI